MSKETQKNIPSSEQFKKRGVNEFGDEIYEPKEVFDDAKVEQHIRTTIESVLGHLEIEESKIKEVVEKCLNLAKNYDTLDNYERDTHNFLNDQGVTGERISEKLTDRAKLEYEQIKPYLKDGSVLDLGCGDGKVGQFLAEEGREVVLADIYKHDNIDKTKLQFQDFTEDEDVPLPDNKFDNTILLTVLHHSSGPLKTLKEAHRLTKPGGRVILIESVYGTKGEGLSKEEKENASSFLSLDKEQQRKANMFFDNFYNRVVHFREEDKVNVPLNFNTPEGWKKLCEENGFEEKDMEQLGIEQPIVPEFHTVHVEEVIK